MTSGAFSFLRCDPLNVHERKSPKKSDTDHGGAAPPLKSNLPLPILLPTAVAVAKHLQEGVVVVVLVNVDL